LFGYVSEKNYEGNSHWLMFLVDILPVVKSLPPKIEEGYFEFFYRQQINDIKIPPTDLQLVWPFFDKRKQGFWGIRADFEKKSPKIKIEAKPF
jgi:8-oxo-dGTP diphosphatase